MSDIVDTSPLGIERTERIAGDDALNSRLDTVTTELQGTQASVTTEVLHRSEGDLVIQRVLEGYIQDLLEGKAEDFERYIEFQNSQNLNYADVRNFVSGIRTSLADEIRNLSTSLMNNLQANDARYDKLVSDVGRYLEILSDITLDSNQITLDNGELRAGAWTILSQARAWDLEIISRLNGLSESVGDSLKDAVEEIQNQLPSTEETITKAIEELSKSPLIKELSDLLNQSIENDIAHQLALLEQARNHANEMSQLAEDMRAEALAKAQEMEDYMAGEVTARITEVNKEVAARKEAIDLLTEDMLTRVDQDKADYQADMLAATNRIIAAEDGLTSEIQHRKDGDTSTLNALNIYKVSNDSAITGLTTSLSNNVTKTSANTTLITGLTSRLETAEDGIDNATTAAADAMSKATTAVTANSALATRVDALAASITESEGTVVDVNAFNALKAEVNTVKGSVTSLVEDITALETNYTSVNNKVTTQGTAISTLNTKMSTAENSISQSANDITLLKTDINTVNAGLLTKVDSQAFSQLSSDVTELDDKYTTQASLVTDLRGSLDTTNVNVGNAASAAQNALTAAGSKGKVIFGTSAPATADRLSQNLWIDTTGGANTPKRWNGSTWAVVTDKVATDALAAANAATSLANTKADTSAFNSLDQKVTVMDGQVSTNTNSITSLDGKIAIVEGGLATKLDSSALVNYYTKQQADDNALSTAAGEISKYDATLKIGGVNLLNGTSDTWQSLVFAGWQQNVYTNVTLASLGLKVGDSIAISGDVEAPSTTDTAIQVTFVGPNTFEYTDFVPAGTTRRAELITTIPAGTTGLTISIGRYTFTNSNDTFKYRSLQLEIGNKASAWAPSNKDTKSSIDANSTAIETTNAEVTRVDGRVTTEANRVTSLTGRVDNVVGDLAKKADASALSSLTTRVETEEGKSTSQGSAITALQNTVNHATTGLATKAASSALTAVDNKVTAANGRIDTTNSNVTTLSGRVATVEGDISKKADASALTSLTTRVEAEEGKSTSQGTAITALQNSVNHATTGLSTKASSAALTAVDNKVIAVDGRVTTTNSNVATLTGRVSTVEGAVATKADVSALNNIYTKSESDAKATSLAAGEVSKYDASLVIGGTNLLLNSNFSAASSSANWASNGGGFTKVTDPIHGSVVQTNLPNGLVHAWLKLENGVEYTYSALIKPTNAITMATNVPLHYHAGLNNVNQSKIQVLAKSHEVIPANTWTRIWIKFKLTSDADSFRPFIYYAGNTTVIQLAWTQLEIGSKATDWKPNPVEVQNSLDVNASAISTTNTEVSRIDGVVAGHTTQLTNLTASIAGKADTAALNALTVRVAEEEGKTSSQATSITNLTSSLSATDKVAKDALPKIGGGGSFKTFKEVLNYYNSSSSSSANIVIETPITYAANMFRISGKGYNYASTKSVIDFDVSGYAYQSTGSILQHGAKNNGTFPMRIRLGMKDGKLCVILSPNGTNFAYPAFTVDATVSYGTVSDVYQTGWTGTQVTEANLASSGITNIIEPSLLDVAAEVTATASALSTLDTKVEEVDGIVSTQASQLIVLTSDNNANKNALTVQGKVIDGVKSSYMVKMETNNVIGGFGLMQSTGVLGQVVTSFGVNADSFFIGAPASKKQPFIVTTTNQVVNGVTYPAGTYIDVALIANATIGNAHIADASITNAKIKELDASKITTGTLDAKHIRVGSTTQFDTGFAPTDVLVDAKSYTDTKTKTFIAQPTTPYARGDIYRNGSSIYVCTTARASGSYVAADWTLVGDVTANNTAADANKLGGTAAATVLDNAAKGIAVYNDVMSDLKITPVEKTALNTEWTRIKAEYTSMLSHAASLGVSTTTYTAAYSALNSTSPTMTSILSSMTTTTTLTAAQRDALRTQFTNYYAQVTALNKAISDKVADNAKAYTDAIEIGGANLLYRSYDKDLWIRYGSPTITLASDSFIMDSSMLATQTTFEGSGGSSTLKVYRQCTNLEVGKTLTMGASVKNRGTKNITVNTAGLNAVSSLTVAPGQIERIVFTGTLTQASAQFRILTVAAADAFAVDINDLKFEYGDKSTSWTPSPSEVNALIDGKSKTFLTTPTVPYNQGDIWKDGATTKVAVVSRSTGSYTAADWVLVGDVTANNTAADTAKVNGVSAATVATNAANGATVYADVMSDLKITPVEKTAINQEWNRIQKEYASLLAQAQALAITTTTFTAAYTGLSTTAPAMSTILASMNTTTTLTAAQRDAYKTQYTTYYTQAVAITKAINDKIAANAKAQADAKSKTFTAQPVTPYTAGDLWKDGTTIKVCTVSRASGSYVAADWTLVGDVTSANTAANANQLGGKASATVLNDIATAASTATTAKGTADAANNQVVLWKYPNTTEIDGGKIRANTVTANQISVVNLSAISSNLGTIKVGSANIDSLAVDTLNIKDNAVTVPVAVTNDTEFPMPYASTTVYGNVNSVLDASAALLGDRATLTLNRAGGRCRIEGTVVLDTVRVTTNRSDGLINGVADKLLCGLVLLRGTTVIARYIVSAPTTINNDVAVFNTTVSLPIYIDAAGTGSTTYKLRVGFTTTTPNGGSEVFAKGTNVGRAVVSASLAVMEIKK